MGILDILYPPRCPVCHGIVRGKDRVCGKCRRLLSYVAEPQCRKCGKGLAKQEQEYCCDCQRFPHAYTAGAAVFAYDEVMRRSIAMFKYHNRREYAVFYAEEMYRRFARRLAFWKPQVIIPVPVSRKKKRQRGFDQAELLAKQLGRLIGIPADLSYIVRREDTIPQKELTRQQRKANLRGAFALRGGAKRYERVLLVDDVYTTGATVDAVSEILRENQTKFIYFLTICVGRNEEM